MITQFTTAVVSAAFYVLADTDIDHCSGLMTREILSSQGTADTEFVALMEWANPECIMLRAPHG